MGNIYPFSDLLVKGFNFRKKFMLNLAVLSISAFLCPQEFFTDLLKITSK